MTAVIIIVILILILYWLFVGKKNDDSHQIAVAANDKGEAVESDIAKPPVEEIFIDEKGQEYKNVIKTKEIPRKTYVLGRLHGKYWGEIDIIKEAEFERCKFYNFNIYEAEVKTIAANYSCFCVGENKKVCDGFHTENDGQFKFEEDETFSKSRLPSCVQCIISLDGGRREYSIVIHDPKIRNVIFSRKLHQNEANEVFGTIDAEITGYMLDFKREEYIDREYRIDTQVPKLMDTETMASETLIPTGNVEYKGPYKRTEYSTNYRAKYWGKWKYAQPANTTPAEGCLSSGFELIGAIIGISFLILLLPHLVLILPFLLIPVLLRFIPASALGWIAGIIGTILFVIFIVSLIRTFSQSSTNHIPKPLVQDQPRERIPQYEPVVDSSGNTAIQDTLITHYRNWNDYSGHNYAGYFSVRKSDLLSAATYKNNLSIIENNERAYDETIYRLKENDKDHLAGVYNLFDSLKYVYNLSRLDFAEMIVSFVQDIPYSVVLPNACNADLYADRFIKEYLSSANSNCIGYQRFGINTPIEFMATLQGDCDTRTLLIYTILARYDYDIALLSSEYYNHSLIGINLAYDGLTYKHGDRRYVLWETTGSNIKPGVIPSEISNTKYWRISLKSK